MNSFSGVVGHTVDYLKLQEKYEQHFPEHTLEELKDQIRRQPIRVAQRLLRLFGDNTEQMVYRYFPDIPEKKVVLDYLKIQRDRWAARNWNRGLVRDY
jgi:hypothetical protein